MTSAIEFKASREMIGDYGRTQLSYIQGVVCRAKNFVVDGPTDLVQSAVTDIVGDNVEVIPDNILKKANIKWIKDPSHMNIVIPAFVVGITITGFAIYGVCAAGNDFVEWIKKSKEEVKDESHDE